MKVIVCGAGQVGTTIARHLATEGCNVTVIDSDPDLVRRIDESYDVRGILGQASHPETLEKAGAQDADLLVAVTRFDEVNMVACQVASSLFDVKRRIARLRHAGYLAKGRRALFAADQLPIDVVISPEIEIAEGIARRLRTPGAFDMVPLAEGRLELLGIHTPHTKSPITGRSIADLAAHPPVEGMSILAIIRQGNCFVPEAGARLEPGDDVYVVARTDLVGEVMAAFGHQERVARRIVILGAGNVGQHLARKVLKALPGTDIKLIEIRRDRAARVATELGKGVVVINGDGLDRAILEEAQAAVSDTIVAVTNDDETNIFASVLAKQSGCKRAITLVNKRSYEGLIPTLGIDSVVSPSAVTISTVLRYVRHGSVLALYSLREDFGEVIEAAITDDSRLLGRPVTDLGLPQGMRVGAVVRADAVLPLSAETSLQPGDHVVAFVSYSCVHRAEALFGTARTSAG